jgi:hypothetical protein
MALDQAGRHIYIADTFNHRVLKFDALGNPIKQWGSKGSQYGQFDHPTGVAVDRDNCVYVTDRFNFRVQKFTDNGEFLLSWGSKGHGDGQFMDLRGVAIDTWGFVWVIADGDRIEQYHPGNAPPDFPEVELIWAFRRAGTGDGQFSNASCIGRDEFLSIYVVDGHRVQKLDTNLQFLHKVGSRGTGRGQFERPLGVADDTAGNVYVVDGVNKGVQIFDPKGKYLSRIYSEYLTHPRGVAVDKSRVFMAGQRHVGLNLYVDVVMEWEIRFSLGETLKDYLTLAQAADQRTLDSSPNWRGIEVRNIENDIRHGFLMAEKIGPYLLIPPNQ